MWPAGTGRCTGEGNCRLFSCALILVASAFMLRAITDDMYMHISIDFLCTSPWCLSTMYVRTQVISYLPRGPVIRSSKQHTGRCKVWTFYREYHLRSMDDDNQDFQGWEEHDHSRRRWIGSYLFFRLIPAVDGTLKATLRWPEEKMTRRGGGSGRAAVGTADDAPSGGPTEEGFLRQHGDVFFFVQNQSGESMKHVRDFPVKEICAWLSRKDAVYPFFLFYFLGSSFFLVGRCLSGWYVLDQVTQVEHFFFEGAQIWGCVEVVSFPAVSGCFYFYHNNNINRRVKIDQLYRSNG